MGVLWSALAVESGMTQNEWPRRDNAWRNDGPTRLIYIDGEGKRIPHPPISANLYDASGQPLSGVVTVWSYSTH